jgi:hypothetical protein
MAEWSKDHMTAICSLNLNFGLIDRIWLNWRLGEPLGEKWRPLVGKVGPTDRSAVVLWIVLGALFLRSSSSIHRC